MSKLLFILIACCASLAMSEWKKIIKNEDDLINTCTKTCDKIPLVTNKFNCKTIKNCRRNSKGWNRGFVRCDYCQCDCDTDLSFKDIKIVKKPLAVTEPDLYGTCTTTCPKRGLVRTSFRGCDEVHNCRKDRNGWTRGFVRCDYCICDCITKSSATQYKLENVKYNMGKAKVAISSTPEVMATVVVVNNGATPQSVERRLVYSVSTTSSLTTSRSLQLGLSLTVEAGVSVGVLSGKLATTTTFTGTKTFTNGKSKSETRADWMTASLTVPGNKQQEVLLVGQKTNVDIPYSATLVTTYKDGQQTKKAITGTYTNVSIRKFRIDYGKASAIDTSSLKNKDIMTVGA